MKRWYWLFLAWYFMLPSWARLGGGSSYRSSSSSSSSRSSSSSYSSGSSYSGGSSYSSGSSGGYSSGGGSGGMTLGTFFFFLVVILICYYLSQRSKGPQDKSSSSLLGCLGLGIGGLVLLTNPPLLGLVALIYFVAKKRAGDSGLANGANLLSSLNGLFAAGGGGDLVGALSLARVAGPRPEPYKELLTTDPNFSLPVFREFAVLLYCQAVQEMATGEFVHARPFLSQQASKQLQQRGASLGQISDIVVGSFQIRGAQTGHNSSIVNVAIESNYIAGQGASAQAYIANEVWTLERRIGLLTQPPKPVSSLSCPSCGYSGDFPASGVCPQCGTTNVKGDFDWVVSSIRVINLETFSPHAAEGGGVEEGTSRPTVTHWEIGRRREEFMTRHPEFSWPDFWSKASGIFSKLQQAWSERDPSQCRPHETNVLFRMHRYWIEDYQRNKKINKLSDVQVDRWELSNIVLDAYYESITARVFASMIDVTTDESGKILYGDPKRSRKFTEYWTFIRRIGGKATQVDSVHQCPSCGAPLDRINQNGECEYCQTVVTLGDFDWVLSNIEQDEVYQA